MTIYGDFNLFSSLLKQSIAEETHKTSVLAVHYSHSAEFTTPNILTTTLPRFLRSY